MILATLDDREDVWQQIKDIVIKTLIMAEEHLFNCNHDKHYENAQVYSNYSYMYHVSSIIIMNYI